MIVKYHLGFTNCRFIHEELIFVIRFGNFKLDNNNVSYLTYAAGTLWRELKAP